MSFVYQSKSIIKKYHNVVMIFSEHEFSFSLTLCGYFADEAPLSHPLNILPKHHITTHVRLPTYSFRAYITG